MTTTEIRALLAETRRLWMTARPGLKTPAQSAAKPAPSDWTPELQAEFGCREVYDAWRRAEARGATICHSATARCD